MSSTPAVVVEAFYPGLVQAVSACLPHRVAAAFVFVVRGDVADRCVQPDAVVLLADVLELGLEIARIDDLLQVGPLALHMPEQGLDPRLVGRGVWAPEVLGDVDPGEELPRRVGPHLRSVVTDREQQRDLPVTDGPLNRLGLPGQQRLPEVLGVALVEQR